MPRNVFRAVSLAVLGGIAVVCLTGLPAAAQFGSIFGDPPRPPSNVPRDDRYPAPPPRRQQLPPQVAPAPPPPPPLAAPQAAPQDLAIPAPARDGTTGIQSQELPPPPGSPPVEGAPQPAALPQPPGAPGLPGQRPRGTAPGAPAANTAPQPGDEVITEMPTQKIANPTAVFSGLDKITGRITSFDAAINETVQFGALQVTPRVCYTRPPTETPNTDSFIEVDEVTLQGEVKRIFTGWTFASSPGLRGVEHPIYDVWLTDCKGGTPAVAEAPPAPTPGPAKPAPAPQPRAQPPRAAGQPGAPPPQRQARPPAAPQPQLVR
jgi:hypothetical protein